MSDVQRGMEGGAEMIPGAVEHRLSLPMRDGVGLATRVWLPAGHRRGPLVLYRTPYGVDHEVADDARVFRAALSRGFGLALQDVRGRYDSEGEFVPYRQEGRDGFDTIEWLAAQPWCDGQIGTFGLSYPGAVQWLAAVESPPHLVAMVPAMCFSRADHFIYFGGAFDLSWPRWAAQHIVPDLRHRRGLASLDPDAVVEEALRLPLLRASVLSESMPEYAEWLAHEPADHWWSWCDLRPLYGRVEAAVLHLSGWHDEAYGPLGAVENFEGLVRARAGAPRSELVLGPWTHGVDAISRARVGDRDLGPSAILDYPSLVLDFLEAHLRGDQSSPPRDAAAVRAYVMGADRWVEASAWPPPGSTQEWLLGPGALEASLPSGATTIESAPASRPTASGDLAYGPFDVSAWALRDDVACFDGPLMQRDLEVVGAIECVLHVSSDAPSHDLYAWLLDVAPDGRALPLSSPGNVVQRVAVGADPNSVIEVRLPNQLTGHCFRRGHRARLAVMGGFEGALSPNLQTGESELVSARSRPARLTIHHSAAHPSRVRVPVLPA